MRHVLAVLASLSPALAVACPVCAQGDRAGSTAFLIGAMIAVPYVITAVVIRAIRSAGDEP
jgi:hypothetical protein